MTVEHSPQGRLAQRCAVALVALAMASPAYARRIVTQVLGVSATVTPSALVSFEIAAQPLTITASDIKRGYVEVVMKSRVHLHTAAASNVSPALVLAMEPRTDLFKSVSVATSARDGEGGHGTPAMVGQSTDDTGAHIAEFRYRFDLKQAARPGGYETALSVNVDL